MESVVQVLLVKFGNGQQFCFTSFWWFWQHQMLLVCLRSLWCDFTRRDCNVLSMGLQGESVQELMKKETFYLLWDITHHENLSRSCWAQKRGILAVMKALPVIYWWAQDQLYRLKDCKKTHCSLIWATLGKSQSIGGPSAKIAFTEGVILNWELSYSLSLVRPLNLHHIYKSREPEKLTLAEGQTPTEHLIPYPQ